jgi:hypothetical protein
MDEKQSPQPISDGPGKKVGNRVWYMLGLGVLLLVILTMLNNRSRLTLGFSDLLKLVKASGKGGHGFIEVVDPTNGHVQRFSQLSNVVVGNSDVTGKVNREFVKANSGNGGEKNGGRVSNQDQSIDVRVERQPQEQQLTQRLEEAGIEWRYAAQPNPLYNYVPLLLMTGLLFMLFVFMIRRMAPPSES